MNPEVRDLTSDDAPALREFFSGMPAEDRTFFFQDVSDPAVADAWAGDARRLRRGAFAEDGRVLAFSALQPGSEWTSHVADIVLVVAPDARRQGLGQALARVMLIEAVEHGFKKVVVTIAADSVGAIQMFQKLGFQGEALLRDHLRSPEDDELRDLVVLAHLVDDQWATMLTGGLDEAIG